MLPELYIYFTMIDKQFLLLKYLSLARMLTRGVINVGGRRSARRKPTCASGRPPYYITYNHCRSRGQGFNICNALISNKQFTSLFTKQNKTATTAP